MKRDNYDYEFNTPACPEEAYTGHEYEPPADRDYVRKKKKTRFSSKSVFTMQFSVAAVVLVIATNAAIPGGPFSDTSSAYTDTVVSTDDTTPWPGGTESQGQNTDPGNDPTPWPPGTESQGQNTDSGNDGTPDDDAPDDGAPSDDTPDDGAPSDGTPADDTTSQPDDSAPAGTEGNAGNENIPAGNDTAGGESTKWPDNPVPEVHHVISTTEETCPVCGGLGKYCERCHGTGKHECLVSNCNNGIETCVVCHGAGKHICYGCWGSGVIKCQVCGQTGHLPDGTTCPSCHGTLVEGPCNHCDGSGYSRCEECNGVGYYTCMHCHGTNTMTCVTCNGNPGPCPNCSGTGKIEKTVVEHVEIGNATLPSTRLGNYEEIYTTEYCSTCNGTGIICPGDPDFGYDRGNGTGFAGCGGTGYTACPDNRCHNGLIVCDGCKGTGTHDDGKRTCDLCNGTGQVVCEFCHGTGIAVCICLGDHRYCDDCMGQGYRKVPKYEYLE